MLSVPCSLSESCGSALRSSNHVNSLAACARAVSCNFLSAVQQISLYSSAKKAKREQLEKATYTTRNASLRRLRVRPAKPTNPDREQGTESTSLPVWLRLATYGARNDLCCIPVSAKPGPFFGLFALCWRLGVSHVWCDAKCFFYACIPSEHRQPACTPASPSPCGSSKPLVGEIRQELRSHSMVMWTEVL